MKRQPTQFKVTFCENCDGGRQEESTAINAIKQVFPNITITTNCVDEYPIHVTIEVHFSDSTSAKVWEGHQRNLFRKYPDLREESIKQIVKSCQDLAEE